MKRSPDIPAGEILENLVTGIAVLTAEDTVIYLNPAAEGLLGISTSQAQGRAIADLFERPDALIDAVEKARRRARTYIYRDLLPARAMPAEPLRLDCRVIPTGDGASAPVLLEINDASARMRISREHALATQQEVSRAIVRQLAHEIKNPLGGLRGAAQLLERQLERRDLRDYTTVILREADRLTALVNKLLGPAGTPNLQATNIHELLDHVFRLVEAEAGEGLRISKDYDPSLPAVLVDRDECIQALLNLARNAAQAVAGTGRVVFRTRARTHSTPDEPRGMPGVRVDVEDDGPGVPEALAETLFYPLVSGRSDGSGLGLALAQSLIRRQDGALSYTSRPGCTVFRIHLRAAAPDTDTDQRSATGHSQ